MALRLATSFCLFVPIYMHLACSACGGSARRAGETNNTNQESANLAVATCDVCAQDAFCNSVDVCTPEGWHCGPMYYNAGVSDGCDCDCGVPDPDCDLPNVERWCYGTGRPYKVAECSACQGVET